jgi:pimeloyl-ACP methyl ester carboxylesterase
MASQAVRFQAADGNVIVGDLHGAPPAAVILSHGGGQTRGAWGHTAARFAAAGVSALSIDLRGHGESAWDPAARYAFTDHARDVEAVATRHGTPVVLVGASLGGVASLIAARRMASRVRAVVLVDVTPNLQMDGVGRILAFMRAKPQGFADLDEAREAIAAYQPHRRRQASEAGMKRNLRLTKDGRWVWRWDPATLTYATTDWLAKQRRDMAAAAAALDVPIVLVRGAESDVVSESDARAFLRLNKQAIRVDVPGARHMVAGDENDLFSSTILGALAELDVLPPTTTTNDRR